MKSSDAFTEREVRELLAKQGYTRIHAAHGTVLEVVQDRILTTKKSSSRLVEAVEAATRVGQGRVSIYPLDDRGRTKPSWRFSTDLHCPHCDLHWDDPSPNLFSFN